MKKLSFLITVVIAFVQTTVIAQTIDIYVAGYEKNSDGKSVAKVWKNGEELYCLTSGVYSVETNSIFVSGNDVYVAGDVWVEVGSSKVVAKIWKNGTELYSFVGNNGNNDAYAKDMYVSGNDVYIAGYEYTSGDKIGWVRKNNDILYNLTVNNNDPTVRSMCISGNDIYVCGRAKDSYGRYKATVWKNGSQLFQAAPTSAPGNYWSEAYDIFVLENVVYLSGEVGSDATIWRYGFNGTMVEGLHTYSGTQRINSWARAHSFDATGTKPILADIYTVVASGYDRIYKNNTILYSFDSTYNNAKITSISVKKDDIYLSGYDKSGIAKIWKNGEELFVLTDGTYNAEANTIFVVEHSGTGMEDIQINNNISLYPNPAKDELRIECRVGACPDPTTEIEIYDVMGKQLQSKIVNLQSEITIDISHLANGMYYLKINGQTGKFVKE